MTPQTEVTASATIFGRTPAEALAALQKTFNTVWAHSAQMVQKSTNGNFFCKYRWEGNKCFVGCLIPDAIYDPKMEKGNVSAEELMFKFPVLTDYWADNGFSIDGMDLVELQKIHDTNFDRREAYLRRYARIHGLSIPQGIEHPQDKPTPRRYGRLVG